MCDLSSYQPSLIKTQPCSGRFFLNDGRLGSSASFHRMRVGNGSVRRNASSGENLSAQLQFACDFGLRRTSRWRRSLAREMRVRHQSGTRQRVLVS